MDIILEPRDSERLANLCGPLDEHLHLIERRLGVEIGNRDNMFSIKGETSNAKTAARILSSLYEESATEVVNSLRVHLLIQESGMGGTVENSDAEVAIQTKRVLIRGRGQNQQLYLRNIRSNDVNLCVGPAGTGKTYLAVACAVEALESDRVKRVVLVRPAVEAGEKLGFLPGDMAQKVDPYLRPLYDALYEMLGFERVAKLVERNVIEVAPLAFMRGRTLNESFIILDEGQNTTTEQMKMFLTRIGFGSTAVVTGDITQIDLPRHQNSGLIQALEVLKGVKGISLTRFSARDVVRHPLVQRIVTAYQALADESESQRGDE